MEIKYLKAFNGDSINIKWNGQGQNRNILIDGGVRKSYGGKNQRGIFENGELHSAINSIRDAGERIDLLILTHVDDDHIAGILEWFKKDPHAHGLVDKVWFNSGRLIMEAFEATITPSTSVDLEFDVNESTNTSIRQGVKFEDYIEEYHIWDRRLIHTGIEPIALHDASIKILSPNLDQLKDLLQKWDDEQPILETSGAQTDYHKSLTTLINGDDTFKSDTSVHNGSSIAFILTFDSKNYLFLGDAFSHVIEDSLKSLNYSESNPLELESMKISHHGSKKNTSNELLKLIKSKKYVISTNGKKHAHPNKKTIARIVKSNSNARIQFNYPELITKIFSNQDYNDFPEIETT